MARQRNRYPTRILEAGLLVTAAIILALVLLAKTQLYLAWLAAFSLTTFALFGMDKRLAVSGRARIPERVLHLFTLLGGFLGQLAGRLLFRHKINFQKHPSFTITPVAGIIIWALIAYLFFGR